MPACLARLQGDVRRYEDCERMAAEAVARFGRLDTLVNCAGEVPRRRHLAHVAAEAAACRGWRWLALGAAPPGAGLEGCPATPLVPPSGSSLPA